MRIAKYISNSGYCSRREAENLIIEKKVTINNLLCEHPSQKILKNDCVKVENKILKLNRKIRLWKMYKPIKYICSNKDPNKRKKVFDLIPTNYPRLISIGRLDFMSEGLLLFTNSGDYARKLELPKTGYSRIYKVCVNNKIEFKKIKKINKGITIDKINYSKINVSIEKYISPVTWLIFDLKEGKNREIRKICSHFSWKIVRLIRIQYGPYKLSKLKAVKIKEIKKLY